MISGWIKTWDFGVLFLDSLNKARRPRLHVADQHHKPMPKLRIKILIQHKAPLLRDGEAENQKSLFKFKKSLCVTLNGSLFERGQQQRSHDGELLEQRSWFHSGHTVYKGSMTQKHTNIQRQHTYIQTVDMR